MIESIILYKTVPCRLTSILEVNSDTSANLKYSISQGSLDLLNKRFSEAYPLESFGCLKVDMKQTAKGDSMNTTIVLSADEFGTGGIDYGGDLSKCLVAWHTHPGAACDFSAVDIILFQKYIAKGAIAWVVQCNNNSLAMVERNDMRTKQWRRWNTSG